MIYALLVRPVRLLLSPGYGRRPLASAVLAAYLRQRAFPTWTSYFVAYRSVQDDQFGEKHFNFAVDGHNYHVLRVGCFPYIKYHCTQRSWQDLRWENRIYRAITVANLGLPCLMYGMAAIGLIRHTDTVVEPTTGRTVNIHFLIREEHN